MLAWIDLEMTGLNPARHTIVEIASLITDDDLAIVEEGPDLVVRPTAAQLAAITRVDQPRRVETGDPVARGQAAARQDEPGVAHGNGDRHPRRHHRAATAACQHSIDPRHEVGAGVSFAGIGGHRQLGV